MLKKLILLGSTGSIGTQVLDIVRKFPREFKVIGMTAHANTLLFKKQVAEFKPKYFFQTVGDDEATEKLMKLAAVDEADIIVNAIVGYAGLAPSVAALREGKNLALANKESIVMAGELHMKLCKKNGGTILPIDSEPSALWQLLEGDHKEVDTVIVTASGGPFLGKTRKQLAGVKPAQALKHPTWKMGKKISIDSATLMNKAFEIIETKWLFDLAPSQIEVVIHPQSIVHGMVQYKDGTLAAVMGAPDMRIPISYALFYPHRTSNALPRLNLNNVFLEFKKPDFSLFEGPKLAYEVLKEGGIMPAAFCIADEIAVKKFLSGEISFLGIYDYIKKVLSRVKNEPLSLEALEKLHKDIYE